MKSVWRGALTFGLVNIPIRLYHASEEVGIKFHLLHKKDLSKIRYARICKTDGKEIPWEDVVKGYQLESGKFVVFTDEDFEKVNPKKAKTLEIADFVNEDEIDPMYFEMPYYLEPEKGAAKAYSLLCEAIKKSKKVAIVTYVFRNHEHLGFIKAQGSALVLIQLRYKADILTAKGLNIPKEKATQREVSVALQFINKMSKKFNPADYRDTYEDEVMKLIKQKSKGKKVTVAKGKEAPVSPKVHDIMSLLKQSVERPKKTRRSA